ERALAAQGLRHLAPSPDGALLAAASEPRRATSAVLAGLPEQSFPAVAPLLVVDARARQVVAEARLPLALDAVSALGWAGPRTLLVGTARGVILVVEVAAP